MAKKFYTKNSSLDINAVDVERESEACVWVKVSGFNGASITRHSKKSTYDEYHDTWEAARESLLARYQRQVESLKTQLQKARTSLGQIESMKKPEAGA